MNMPQRNKNSNKLVMDIISKKMTSYAATQWLKSPNKSLDDKAPFDLMSEGKAHVVYKHLVKQPPQ
jgi:uncharacterized protein (DUF2384 family)